MVRILTVQFTFLALYFQKRLSECLTFKLNEDENKKKF
jgi:hypothetical protein